MIAPNAAISTQITQNLGVVDRTTVAVGNREKFHDLVSMDACHEGQRHSCNKMNPPCSHLPIIIEAQHMMGDHLISFPHYRGERLGVRPGPFHENTACHMLGDLKT